MIRTLRKIAVNRADGGKSIKRGTIFKAAEREKYYEGAKTTQTRAVNMWSARQCCL